MDVAWVADPRSTPTLSADVRRVVDDVVDVRLSVERLHDLVRELQVALDDTVVDDDVEQAVDAAEDVIDALRDVHDPVDAPQEVVDALDEYVSTVRSTVVTTSKLLDAMTRADRASRDLVDRYTPSVPVLTRPAEEAYARFSRVVDDVLGELLGLSRIG